MKKIDFIPKKNLEIINNLHTQMFPAVSSIIAVGVAISAVSSVKDYPSTKSGKKGGRKEERGGKEKKGKKRICTATGKKTLIYLSIKLVQADTISICSSKPQRAIFSYYTSSYNWKNRALKNC